MAGLARKEDSPMADRVQAAAPPWEGVVEETPSGIRVGRTRITIWDVYYYRMEGFGPEAIALAMPALTAAQVEAAFAYIDAHHDEVHRVHEQIEARIARGHPPEVQAKLDAIHAELGPFWAARRAAANTEGGDEGHPRGR
jgi:uncharacterized protein (DUF433 family)